MQQVNPVSESDRSVVLEQYKLYVEMADRVSSRRQDVSKFYSTLITGLLVVLPFAVSEAQKQHFTSWVLGATGVFGLTLCSVWFVNIASYKQLNSLKFKVVHEMESFFPYAPYDREWQILKDSSSEQSYRRLTTIERYVPIVLSLPFLALLVYALVSR